MFNLYHSLVFHTFLCFCIFCAGALLFRKVFLRFNAPSCFLIYYRAYNFCWWFHCKHLCAASFGEVLCIKSKNVGHGRWKIFQRLSSLLSSSTNLSGPVHLRWVKFSSPPLPPIFIIFCILLYCETLHILSLTFVKGSQIFFLYNLKNLLIQQQIDFYRLLG